ncbi:MAG: hypothetical protein ACQKBV_09775, partial [Puniceicoccales bacterium]
MFNPIPLLFSPIALRFSGISQVFISSMYLYQLSPFHRPLAAFNSCGSMNTLRGKKSAWLSVWSWIFIIAFFACKTSSGIEPIAREGWSYDRSKLQWHSWAD